MSGFVALWWKTGLLGGTKDPKISNVKTEERSIVFFEDRRLAPKLQKDHYLTVKIDPFNTAPIPKRA